MSTQWLLSLAVLLCIFPSGIYGQDSRVKLCGREFIRMVVTSCGSSRSKRFTPELDEQHVKPIGMVLEWLMGDQFSYQRGLVTNEISQRQSRDPESSGMVRDFPSSTEHARSSSKVKKETRDVKDSRSPANLHAIFTETQHDAGPAGVCCRSGCTMSELVQYC
ncbi:insulin-like 3 (Leydig cell) [Brienomyrus brachyistius]|uniref:insulin-like 3 (Leydig cell) n=1 Tax=Brienomyrus brachyistius TaxID=42636 RepID=UPI0020B3829A|nr:insulin-like 3 (Leydig cell) [Brienomyrus brachyistius]